MKKLFPFVVMLVLMSFNMMAQDIHTSYRCGADLDDNGTYTVTLTGVSAAKAVNLLVDQIKSRNAEPQQIGIYIVEYEKDTRAYTVYIDETIQGVPDYPKNFTNISDVRKLLKQEIKNDLDNL